MSPYFTADHVKEQTMNPLRSTMSRFFRGSKSTSGRNRTSQRKVRRQRLCLEALEDRSVPSTFNFTDFSNVSSLNLLGHAASVNNVLRLTPAQGGLTGGAWYNV